MGLLDGLDELRRRYFPGTQPILAERFFSIPWNTESGAINASASVSKHFQDGTGDRHRYALERVTIVNNSPNCDIKARPNGDKNREQVIGRGGGTYTIDSGDIAYIQIENLSATTAVAANEVLITGEAFLKGV